MYMLDKKKNQLDQPFFFICISESCEDVTLFWLQDGAHMPFRKIFTETS